MANEDVVADLQRKFGIPGVADVVSGNGGLAKVRVRNAGSSGEIYLHGAHVTSWHPAQAEEIFFLSSSTKWEDGKAIRGGIPICFPWFRGKSDDPKAPAHGVVRTKSWQLDAITQAGDAVTVSMTTASDEGTKKWWPYDFQLRYKVTFGPEFVMELTTTNTGKAPVRIEEALHCYFSVGSAASAKVHELDGVHYLDNMRGNVERVQQADVQLTEQTDNAYLDTQSPVELEDQEKGRRIHIVKENSQSTVVWNPWREGATKLNDLGKDEWMQMLCVEPCNILSRGVNLAAGEQHTIGARIRAINL